MDPSRPDPNSPDWLVQVLEEVGLQQFHSKLTNDLQLTKLPHFDFVSEEDLIKLGMSKPASKRLLAAIKKKKSFVTALKNCILNKIISSPSIHQSPSNRKKSLNEDIFHHNSSYSNSSTSHGRLTCLINTQDVKIKEEIGHGAHGFVKKGEWTTPSGRVVEVAVKILHKDVTSDPGASFNDFVKEISVMHQLNHPNIIKLFGVVLSSPMMMVTELAPFGNLRDRLRSESGHTTIAQLISFGVQIASGMSYLENKRFVHRDIAARNIFISHGEKILIGDFGLMRAIPTQDDHYTTSEKTKIPYPWCAPESLKYKQFSSASDVYMFGVTLWEMFSFGKEPWAGLNMSEILENISSQKKRLTCPPACPSIVYQTLLQCWDTVPTCRPNFATLYQYLSTSYPLEVKCMQNLCETSPKRLMAMNEGISLDNLATGAASINENIKILNCLKDDRIFVIDGQPEKYWWKGQNQRTFQIGWFPLNSTRWLTPKKVDQFAKCNNLKNNLAHFNMNQLESKNPKCSINYPIVPSTEQLTNLKNLSMVNNHNIHQPKSKAKIKLSRLFGMNTSSEISPWSAKAHLIPNSNQRLIRNKKSEHNNTKQPSSNDTYLVRSQSVELNQSVRKVNEDDSLLLIDFSDVNMNPTKTPDISRLCLSQEQPISILDMDNPVPPGFKEDNEQEQGQYDRFSEVQKLDQQHRHASDTRLDLINADSFKYPPSCDGSWNTGTFYDSNPNVYSAYYCPQDAINMQPNKTTNSNIIQQTISIDPNRYYSMAASSQDTD